jgi:hypothetical protein
MALPSDMRWRIEKRPPRTREHERILKDFEDAYDRAVADEDWDEVRRLVLAFNEVWDRAEDRLKKAGLAKKDPFNVKV